MNPIPAILLLFTCSCAVPTAAPDSVRSWGTLREALRDGQSHARVDVKSVLAADSVGIGAVAGLDGEITIVDGEIFVSRVRDGKVQTTSPDDVAATMLVTSRVPEWREIAVDRDVDPSDFARFVAAEAELAGLETDQPFPFVVEGDLRHLQIHVVAGECPIRARMLDREMASQPHESHYERIHGRVVGVYAKDAAGQLTHHGEQVHAHAIVTDASEFTGHVESVGIARGAVLRLPAAR